MASTRTRPLLSAATVKPQSTDLANESSTERRSAGLALEERKDLVGLDQQHLGSDALERDEPPVAFLAAVEADVVGAESGGQAGGVEEWTVEARDLEPEIAGALVPVEREVAVQLLHAGGALFDGGRGSSRSRGRAAAPLGGKRKHRGGQCHRGPKPRSEHPIIVTGASYDRSR